MGYVGTGIRLYVTAMRRVPVQPCRVMDIRTGPFWGPLQAKSDGMMTFV